MMKTERGRQRRKRKDEYTAVHAYILVHHMRLLWADCCAVVCRSLPTMTARRQHTATGLALRAAGGCVFSVV